MSVLYIVLPAALLVVAIAVAAYVWAARRGQFDDLITPAMRMLNDDDAGPRDPAGPPGRRSPSGERSNRR